MADDDNLKHGPAGGGHPTGHYWPVVVVNDHSTIDDDRWAGRLTSPATPGHGGAVVLPVRPPMVHGSPADFAAEDLLGLLGRASSMALKAADSRRQTRLTHIAPWLLSAGLDDLVVLRAHWLLPHILSGLVELCAAAGTRIWLLCQPPPLDVARVLAAHHEPSAALSWPQFRAAWEQRPPGPYARPPAQPGPHVASSLHAQHGLGPTAGQQPTGQVDAAPGEELPVALPAGLVDTDPIHLREALRECGGSWIAAAQTAVNAAHRRAAALLTAGLPRTRMSQGGKLRTSEHATDSFVLETVLDAALRSPTPALAVVHGRGAQLAALDHGWHVHLTGPALVTAWHNAIARAADQADDVEMSLRYDRDPLRPAAAALADAGVPTVLLANLTVGDAGTVDRNDPAAHVTLCGQRFHLTPAGAAAVAALHTRRLLELATDAAPLLPLGHRSAVTAASHAGLLEQHARMTGVRVGLHRLLGCPTAAHRTCPQPATTTPLRLNDPTLLAARDGPPGPARTRTSGQLTAEQTAVALTRRSFAVQAALLRQHPGWRDAADAR